MTDSRYNASSRQIADDLLADLAIIREQDKQAAEEARIKRAELIAPPLEPGEPRASDEVAALRKVAEIDAQASVKAAAVSAELEQILFERPDIHDFLSRATKL
jgi:hypothetical protein